MPGELDEVLTAFDRLVGEHEAKAAETPEDDDNFRCVDCTGCSSCRFCTACEGCIDCTYCDASVDCESCTQCRELLACANCSHSNHTAYCEKSSYLTLCLDCDNCVQCFACVGLSGEEFCVLNQRYTRRAYFKKVAELRAALDARTLEGWFPPWVRDKAAAAPDPEPRAVPAAPRMEPTERRPPPAQPRAVPVEPRMEPTERRPSPAEPPRRQAERPEPRAEHPEPRAERSAEPRAEHPEPRAERPEPQAERPRATPEPPTIHPEPLTDIAAAERTGSWPPIDHEAARALDRAGSSPWDALDEDAQASDVLGAEPDTIRGPPPPERAVSPRPKPAPPPPREPVARPRPAVPPRPAEPPMIEATEPRPRPKPARFGGPDEPAPSRFGKPAPRGERELGSLLDEDDDDLVDPQPSRELIDGLPQAGRRAAPQPEEPQPVEVEQGRREGLTRGQRPTRGTESPTTPGSSLRAARRPRRPDR